KPARWDRNPHGLLKSQPTQRHDLRHGCCVRAVGAPRSEIENGSALGNGQVVERQTPQVQDLAPTGHEGSSPSLVTDSFRGRLTVGPRSLKPSMLVRPQPPDL